MRFKDVPHGKRGERPRLGPTRFMEEPFFINRMFNLGGANGRRNVGTRGPHDLFCYMLASFLKVYLPAKVIP